MPRLIDRYIIRSIIPPFLISLLVFTFLLVVPPLIELADQLVAKGVPAPTIMRLTATLLPQALAVTIPMAVLVGILIGLGRFSADREWVAVQACGGSIYRIARPVVLFAIAGWLATSWVIIEAMPDANQAFRDITFRLVAERTESEVKPRVFYDDFPNVVIYVRDVPTDGSGWRDVFIADTGNPNNVTVFLAARGHLIVDRDRRSVELTLDDGSQHITKVGDPADYTVVRFDHILLTLNPDAVFPRNGPVKGENELTIAELRQRVWELESLRHPADSPTMAIQRKFSIPVACLVFAVIGVVLGLTTRRDGKMAGFAIGLGVIFAYYGLLTMAQNATKGRLLSAPIAPWVPDLVLGLVGLAVLLARGSAIRRWRTVVGRTTLWLGVAGRVMPRIANLLRPSPAADGDAAMEWTPRTRSTARAWIPPGMAILDAYLSRIYVGVFGLAFSGFLALFYISSFIELSEKLFKGQTSIRMLLTYLYWATPQFVYYCIPLAVLIGGLVTIGVVTRSSELTVMRACGISLYRSMVPLVIFGILASGGLFWLEEQVMPATNRRAQELQQLIRMGAAPSFDISNRRWMMSGSGDIYYYLAFVPQRAELNALSVFRFAPKAWRLQGREFYQTATFQGQTSGAEPVVTWKTSDGWVRDFDRQTQMKSFRTVRESTLALEPPQFFSTEDVEADRMTFGQIKQYIAEMKSNGFSTVHYELAMFRKISFPWVTLIMTVIAVPFAVTTGRRGAMYGIGLGIVLAVIYRLADIFFAALGSGGAMMPLLAAWAANILFAAVALYLLLTVRT